MREITILKRKIIKMNKELCKGCGICVQACHEGAIRMEVPCCSGIFKAVKTARLNAKNIVPYKELVIGIDVEVKK